MHVNACIIMFNNLKGETALKYFCSLALIKRQTPKNLEKQVHFFLNYSLIRFKDTN